MSVEPKRNGSLRLRCDADGCERKFVPLRQYTSALELRKRAELYGWSLWHVRPGSTETKYEARDLCPEHRP